MNNHFQVIKKNKLWHQVLKQNKKSCEYRRTQIHGDDGSEERWRRLELFYFIFIHRYTEQSVKKWKWFVSVCFVFRKHYQCRMAYYSTSTYQSSSVQCWNFYVTSIIISKIFSLWFDWFGLYVFCRQSGKMWKTEKSVTEKSRTKKPYEYKFWWFAFCLTGFQWQCV